MAIEDVVKAALQQYRQAVEPLGFGVEAGELKKDERGHYILPITTKTPTLMYNGLKDVYEAGRKLWVKFGRELYFDNRLELVDPGP